MGRACRCDSRIPCRQGAELDAIILSIEDVSPIAVVPMTMVAVDGTEPVAIDPEAHGRPKLTETWYSATTTSAECLLRHSEGQDGAIVIKHAGAGVFSNRVHDRLRCHARLPRNPPQQVHQAFGSELGRVVRA